MDTTKILAFRHPSQAELLLESMLRSLDRLPEQARKVMDRSELPSCLQRIANTAAKRKHRWGAWRAGSTIWLFTAEVTAAPAGNARRPALKVCGYNQRGKLFESNAWVNVAGSGWRRCNS